MRGVDNHGREDGAEGASGDEASGWRMRSMLCVSLRIDDLFAVAKLDDSLRAIDFAPGGILGLDLSAAFHGLRVAVIANGGSRGIKVGQPGERVAEIFHGQSHHAPLFAQAGRSLGQHIGGRGSEKCGGIGQGPQRRAALEAGSVFLERLERGIAHAFGEDESRQAARDFRIGYARGLCEQALHVVPFHAQLAGLIQRALGGGGRRRCSIRVRRVEDWAA